MVRLALATVLVLLLAATGFAQVPQPDGALVLRLDAVGQAELERRVELVNRLPSPSIDALFVDGPLPGRLPDTPQAGEPGYAGGPTIITVVIPAGTGGTGTTFLELFYYQLPTSYDPGGAPVPMVMGYHGFGLSAASVHNLGPLDEEAEARGWIYCSPTGVDDKLFASELSQAHVDVVFDYMETNFNVDAERLYMVGFSMGGGYSHNYAARRKDPTGRMIAAIGTVSAAVDWTMVYITEGIFVKNLLEWPENFGGSPQQHLDLYQAASALHFDPASYPPVPGVLVEDRTMAFNNVTVPCYMTYDTGDILPQIPPLNEELYDVISSSGAPVEKVVVSGTVNGEGEPDTHSWNVLDAADCFDFLEQHTAPRYPEDFRALCVADGQFSWVSITQRDVPMVIFTPFEAAADPAGRTLAVTELAAATGLTIHADDAGITGTDPVRVEVEVVDGSSVTLTLEGFATRPSYLRDAGTGQLVAGVDTLLAEDALQLTLQGPTTFAVDVIQDALWNSSLSTTPNPVELDSSTDLALDGPVGATVGALLIGLSEQLYFAKGTFLAVVPLKVLFVPTDAQGDLAFAIPVADDPALDGLRVPLQGVLLDGSNFVQGVSNVWGLEITDSP